MSVWTIQIPNLRKISPRMALIHHKIKNPGFKFLNHCFIEPYNEERLKSHQQTHRKILIQPQTRIPCTICATMMPCTYDTHVFKVKTFSRTLTMVKCRYPLCGQTGTFTKMGRTRGIFISFVFQAMELSHCTVHVMLQFDNS